MPKFKGELRIASFLWSLFLIYVMCHKFLSTSNNMVLYLWPITDVNNVLTPAEEIVSHTKSQINYIKSKDDRNK